MSASRPAPAHRRWDEGGVEAIAALMAETTARWPYSRPPDADLLARWREDAQPEHRLMAIAGGRVVAALHGERHGDEHLFHLVAALPGASAALAELMGVAVAGARRDGLRRVRGPHHRAGTWYGGYICGCEPYLPHAAVAETEAFVRAGFRVSHPAQVMVAERGLEVGPARMPDGYELALEAAPPERGADTFRCVARDGGREVATCGARSYDALLAGGLPVGQLGFVGTDAAHRGRGLAGALTRDALRRLRRRGVGDVLIATGLDNAPALRAYERAGFARRFAIFEWSRELG